MRESNGKDLALAAFALLVLAVVIPGQIGCGSGRDTSMEAKNLQTAKDYRSYFDKVHGDYAALNSADRAAYVKMAGGDEKKAVMWWDKMKFGPGGAPSGQETKPLGTAPGPTQ